MAMERTLYKQVCERMKPGDIVAFSGRSRFSRLIRLTTRAVVSHVGIICQTENSVEIIESVTFAQDRTSAEEVEGVRYNDMHKRVTDYDGFVWWLPLSEDSRASLNQKKMVEFLQTTEGKKYDMPQAIKAALDIIEENPFFDLSTYNQEDFDAFFCSELVAAALRAGGVIETINPSEVTPSNLCSFKLFAEDYYQLKGRRKEIDDYNQNNPEGFGL